MCLPSSFLWRRSHTNQYRTSSSTRTKPVHRQNTTASTCVEDLFDGFIENIVLVFFIDYRSNTSGILLIMPHRHCVYTFALKIQGLVYELVVEDIACGGVRENQGHQQESHHYGKVTGWDGSSIERWLSDNSGGSGCVGSPIGRGEAREGREGAINTGQLWWTLNTMTTMLWCCFTRCLRPGDSDSSMPKNSFHFFLLKVPHSTYFKGPWRQKGIFIQLEGEADPTCQSN